MRVIAKGQQRSHIAISHQPDVSALATVAAIGPTAGDVRFTSEGHTAGAAVASANIELDLVDESGQGSRLYRAATPQFPEGLLLDEVDGVTNDPR